jgi:hypothetical protein
MVGKVIYIPTLEGTPRDVVRLCEISSEVSKEEDVCFNFSQCQSLYPNTIACIGGIIRLGEGQKRRISLDWDSLESNDLKNILSENGFAKAFNYPFERKAGHSIPYREDKKLSMNSILDYLADDWLGRGWVHVSQRLANAIVGKMWEIYNNAFEHSGTPIGVFSCGQHFEAKNELILSVVDFGRGIPAIVRKFLSEKVPRAEELKDTSCLNWAFQRGNSTCAGDVARGLGLDLLKELVVLNQGKLEVYSNKAYAIIDKDGERYENFDASFGGTMIHITLQCDEKLYKFKDESDPIFQEGI